METPLSSDIMAIAALVSSLGAFIGSLVTMVNSFRNGKKIDDTHDIAKATFNQTQRVYISPLKNQSQVESD